MRYTVTVEIRTDTGLLRVTDERVAALRADGEESQGRRPYLERVANRLHLRMEGQAHPTYYDVGLDHTLLSRPLYAPHYPHLTALREELRRWRVFYFDPEALRAESPLRQTTTLSPRGADLPAYMNTLQTSAKPRFKALVQALKFIIPSVQDVRLVLTPEGFLSLSIVENGIPFSARVVSEGTLRVLGLLAITDPQSPSSFVGYEEPENGVHPRRLELIAEVLRNAASKKHVQLLVNTHSSVLPELLADARLYACTKDEGSTRFRDLATGLFAGAEAREALLETSYQQRAMSGEFGG
jgi:predicted ATPase